MKEVVVAVIGGGGVDEPMAHAHGSLQLGLELIILLDKKNQYFKLSQF